jgi:hypothetical protein
VSDHARVTATLRSVDRLACEVDGIDVSTDTLQTASPQQLRALADQLTNQLSYLEEQLTVLEVDAVAHEVQVRSEQPRQARQSAAYFEVSVHRTGIAVRRFQKAAGKARARVPAVLTRDTFCRVCMDLLSIVQSQRISDS